MGRAATKATYPTKAKVEFAIRMAKLGDPTFELGELAISPDGTVRVLRKGDKQPAMDSAYDRWKAARQKD